MKIYSIAKKENRSDEEKFNRDIDDFLRQFRNALPDGYSEKVFRSTDIGDMILFLPKSSGRKRILVMSGQHGEEIAGPWAVLEFIKENPELLKKADISFLPVMNVYGFVNNKRNGDDDKKTNWFLDENGGIRDLGNDAKAIHENISLLAKCAKDGFLNIHEDYASSGFYLYVIGDIKSAVVKRMLDAGKKFFDLKRDGEYNDNGKYELKGGIVDNYRDETFDDMFTKEYDIPISITIETPQVDAKIDKRVKASSMMAGEFVKTLTEK